MLRQSSWRIVYIGYTKGLVPDRERQSSRALDLTGVKLDY